MHVLSTMTSAHSIMCFSITPSLESKSNTALMIHPRTPEDPVVVASETAVDHATSQMNLLLGNKL